MPKPAPLAMPTQNFARAFTDRNAPNSTPFKATLFFRVATMLPALLITVVLVIIFSDWFQRDGFTAVELTMIGLVGFSSFWIALSVAASMIGILLPRGQTLQSGPVNPISVALLMPVYNEDPAAVFKRIRTMRDDLAGLPSSHTFSIFILSDTSDNQIALLESREFDWLRSTGNNEPSAWYRRRAKNTERKTGNLRNWIETWGGDWDAFITLDADSLMSAEAIHQLADNISSQPDTALIQTVPQLFGANTLFARVQQFANNTYGGVLACGLDRWSGHDGNYWGHNAIIKTSAFAACAGLPKLSGKGALGGTIKSHDFVEAALLCRAGWSVRLVPSIDESYEETPQNIVDYVQRDHRWCQGNLQHLRIIASSGFTTASRFHMLQGAMAYISSVVWFALLILWTLMGRSEDQNVFHYFTDANPLFPQWPHMDAVSRMVVLCFMLGLLLTPKLLGLISSLWKNRRAVNPAPVSSIIASAVLEIIVSFLLAPILMAQHVKSVVKTVIGMDSGWAQQNRSGQSYGFLYLARFHWFEILTGLSLSIGILTGVVTLWLVPIAAGLTAAPILSKFVALKLHYRKARPGILATRESFAPPKIIQNVQAEF